MPNIQKDKKNQKKELMDQVGLEDDGPDCLRSETHFFDIRMFTVGNADLDDLIRKLWNELNEFERIVYQRQRFHDILKIVLENLIYTRGLPVSISRRNGHYGDIPARYNIKKVKLGPVKLILAFLEKEKYVTHTKGFFNRKSGASRYSQITPTAKFKKIVTQMGLKRSDLTKDPESEILILKTDSKKLKDYRESQTVKKMRSTCRWINNSLREYDFKIMQDKFYPAYYRVFNSNFKHGARFYSAFQNYKKEDRYKILINNEETVELDFSGIHIQMLYLKKTGRLYPSDVYTIENHENLRDFFKVVLQISINARKRSSALSAIRYAQRSFPESKKLDAKTILELFEKKHEVIKSFFCSGIGVHLQFLDARIASKVMVNLLKQKIPVLGVHDSFIVQKKHEQKLREVMGYCSKMVLGAELKVK